LDDRSGPDELAARRATAFLLADAAGLAFATDCFFFPFFADVTFCADAAFLAGVAFFAAPVRRTLPARRGEREPARRGAGPAVAVFFFERAGAAGLRLAMSSSFLTLTVCR
jgi:hypothetical protein